MSGHVIECISPVDGRVYARRSAASPADVESALAAALRAQKAWRAVPIEERARQCTEVVEVMLAMREDIVTELAWQMGRPVRFGGGELGGFEERARHMIRIAPAALSDIEPEPLEGIRRRISREPLGIVLVLAPWNYPFLTAVNSVIPALMAGNAVILKHSSQTPLVGERFADACAALPRGLFTNLFLSHEQVSELIASGGVDQVNFTGSVPGGRAVEKAAAERFLGIGLELGGKDPAYVRPDADLAFAVEGLVDGAFFNSGQSCCGIERIYVHQDCYKAFVEAFVETTRAYRLGSPLEEDTTLGPMVRGAAADYVRAQIRDASRQGAKPLIEKGWFPEDMPGSPYLAPQVLVNVDHSMSVMRDESFGPVVGIMPVSGDHAAVQLMNDSAFGLTASVWTRDVDAADRIGGLIETGTVFMNRCDYLDPALAWTGVKDTGRGATLSLVGYETLTRPKSYHLRYSW